MSKKIAFVIPDINQVGGVERVALNLQKEIRKLDHKVDIVSLFSKNSEVEAIHLDIDEKLLSIKRFFLKSDALKVLDKYDLIVGGNFFRYYSNPMFFKDSKNIEIQHMNFEESVQLNGFRKVLSFVIRRYFYNKLDSLVVLTEREKVKFVENNYKNVSVIENGINLNDVNNAAEGRLVSFGRLTYQKGFDKIIPRFRTLVEKLPNIKWDIYAEGEMQSEVEELIDTYQLRKNIRLKKFTNDVLHEMSNASLLIFPSRYEGFPLTLLEAMSVGLPCVAFDCDSGPSEIISDGEDGFVIPQGDIDLFLEKTYQLLSNEVLRSKFSKNAKDNVSRYSLAEISKKWEVLFESL